MSLDQKIANAIIDNSITNLRRYGKEKLQDLKENLDLDQDGRSDFDQSAEMLEQLVGGLKVLSNSIDFVKIANNLQILSTALRETAGAFQTEEAKKAIATCQESSAGLLKLIGLALNKYKASEAIDKK
jgi:hypothetical protein